MSLPSVTLLWHASTETGDEFTIEDPVLGLLDTGGVLDGDLPVDLSEFVRRVRVSRGRTDTLDDFSAGTATITLEDTDRRFDSANALSPYFGQLSPGKRVQVFADEVQIFEGRVRAWKNTYRANAAATTTLIVEDALADLGRRSFTEWTTVALQTAGERIAAALDRAEVAFGANRDLDAGVSQLQADLVTWQSNVLNYLQLVARSDLGRLFVSRMGVLTFRDRRATTGTTSVLTFDDTGSGADIESIDRSDDAVALYNRVVVDRESGIAQTAEDSTARIVYGVRTLPITQLLLNTDSQALDMANYLLGVYSTPEQRIERVSSIVTTADEDVRVPLLQADISEIVRVTWTPLGIGSALDAYSIIEGIEHDISEYRHEVTFVLSPVENRVPWTLEDEVLGALDGVAVLSF